MRWNVGHGSLNGFCRSESMGRWNLFGGDLRGNSRLFRPRIGPNGMRKNRRINELEPHFIDDVIRNTPDDPPDPINLANVDAHVTNGFGFIEAIDVEPLLYRPRYSAVFPHPPAPINARNRQGMENAFITDGKNRLIWFVAGEIGSR